MKKKYEKPEVDVIKFTVQENLTSDEEEIPGVGEGVDTSVEW